MKVTREKRGDFVRDKNVTICVSYALGATLASKADVLRLIQSFWVIDKPQMYLLIQT